MQCCIILTVNLLTWRKCHLFFTEKQNHLFPHMTNGNDICNPATPTSDTCESGMPSEDECPGGSVAHDICNPGVAGSDIPE